MSTLRNTIKSLVARTPYRLTRAVGGAGASVTGLDLVLSMAIRFGWRLRIIQIGANDGMIHDPLYNYLKAHDFPALFVEPLGGKLDRVRSLYAARDSCRFAEVAISDQPGEAPIYTFPTGAGLPEWTGGVASLDRNVLLSHAHLLGMSQGKLATILSSHPVKLIPVSTLLEQFPEFLGADLVQIDAEGHDDRIVESLLNSPCRPTFINFEHRHLPLARQDRVRERLAGEGYSFLVSDMDTLSWRRGSDRLDPTPASADEGR
jgi:hypothetical protein